MKTSITPEQRTRQGSSVFANPQAGVSLVEILIVIVVMMIMMTFAIFSMTGHKTLYKSDDETLRILNVLREASQLALTQRQPMRVELDATNKTIRIVDENNSGSTDDKEVRKVFLENAAVIRIDAAPSTVSHPNPPDYTDADFGTASPKVWKIWFRRDGRATDTSGNTLSVTLFVWPPSASNTNAASSTKLVRAITVFGGNGAIRLWKYNGTTFIAS